MKLALALVAVAIVASSVHADNEKIDEGLGPEVIPGITGYFHPPSGNSSSDGTPDIMGLGPEVPMNKTMSESLFKGYNDVMGEPASCNKVCIGRDYKPICGSNGHSYTNECALKIARCKHPSEKITKASDGVCSS